MLSSEVAAGALACNVMIMQMVIRERQLFLIGLIVAVLAGGNMALLWYPFAWGFGHTAGEFIRNAFI